MKMENGKYKLRDERSSNNLTLYIHKFSYYKKS